MNKEGLVWTMDNWRAQTLSKLNITYSTTATCGNIVFPMQGGRVTVDKSSEFARVVRNLNFNTKSPD